MEGIAPIYVNKAGVRPVTYQVGIDKDSLFGDIAGAGLTYDKGTDKLQVCLSRDTGNSLRFGADGCLYAPGGETPVPDVCARPIESLPAAPNVVGAAELAGLMGPYSSPYQVDYCLAEGYDIVHFHTCTTSDGVGVVTDYWDHIISAGRSSLYLTQDARQMTAATIQSTFNYAGDVDDPRTFTWGDDDVDLEKRKDRRGGWYGWLAQRYYQPLASDFLRKIDAKSVALLDCSPDPERAAYPESDAIIGPMQVVLDHCAQSWSMIGVRELTNATTVENQGITAIMMPLKPTTWGDATLPYPVADLTAAGVEWIALYSRHADSVFTAYKDAGLQVLMRGTSRQSEYTRVSALGIRGVLQFDPSYYRGPGTVPALGGRGYRMEFDPWEHRRMGTGQLSFHTDQQLVLASGGHVRGRTEDAEQGLVLPSGFGDGRDRAAVLCGWECPMANPTSYTITFDLKWDTLSASATAARMGLLFGAVTDADPYSWPQNDPVANPAKVPAITPNCYRVYQRQNGEIGIGRFAADGSYTLLATRTSPAVSAGVWNTYELVVTADQITFTRVRSDGTRHTVTAADTTWRGAYFWVEKTESTTGSTATGFTGRVRNVSYT
ncbi:hypothetical protein [Streptomyces sp. sk2.1]|uniref:hypothetical protein n=1 Tax=Streptomyces sp. sk2.1 TaxID=2478959 RepID=UPI0011E73C89|nr:hypothetical protein [Streptomyces sp. sk2.1]TXS78703.1 hypothetical protein EAO76_10105 [Streptomyces sp. sk2.1]